MYDLLLHYIRTGILQFGRFQQPDGDFHPLQANFLLLPSYPEVMKLTAQAFAPMVKGADRLLATRAMIPTGAVLAVESGVPLTYPYGEAKDYTAAYTIEGAYDVGHPTLLLTDILSDEAEVQPLINIAEKVGLEVKGILCIFAFQHAALPVYPLINLKQVIPQLVADKKITPHLQTHLIKWLDQSSTKS